MKSAALLHITHSLPALISLSTFFIAYIFVIFEEFIHLQKSKPLLMASSIIWILVAWSAQQTGQTALIHTALRQNLTDFVELFLFILVAITYINILKERKVFEALRSWFTQKGYTYRQLFWMTGILGFFMSPITNNLTTALALSAVILAVGKDNPKFTGLACINLVVAANAGGSFSPFGDITTLMVWQAGIIPFTGFFKLLFPATINFLVPAICIHCALPTGKPHSLNNNIVISEGGKQVIVIFLLSIATTICLQQFLHLPPALGMMLGLGYLQLYAYYTQFRKKIRTIEIFHTMKDIDWDTLLFFYGIILAIGGLATLGYLEIFSNTLYSNEFSLDAANQHTPGNILIGILSALIDNIPLMFAVITMKPVMSEGQWLLLTLTIGVGGSLLSIGSAAGVAVMGQARGLYNFSNHLKWTWAIALGYAASIACHLWWNAATF